MKAPDTELTRYRSSPENRSTFKRYGFAALAVLFAFLIRRSLDPLMDNGTAKHAFITFIVATTLVAWYSGFVPSIITFVFGFMLADWFFLEPNYALHQTTRQYLDTMVPPILVCMTIILFGRSMHTARERADAHALEAIKNQERLAAEVIERKRAEDEVRRLNAELEERVQLRTSELVASNQELESFTYSVSHDLRAPLRHVDGYAQILEEEFGPAMSEEARKFARKIRQGSQNMAQLVDDLLNLSRVGKKELARQRVALDPLVASVISEMKLEAPNRQIEWKISPLPNVYCDSGLMRQVFTNLLSNAVKYTRPRERAVIELGESKLNGESAIFVRDNGVGFNMKYSSKLFGVFQRFHRAEEFEGTGVGLATVARIIRKHGGRIWAEAELNKGAAFFFTLPPLRQPAPAAANGKSEAVADHAVAASS